MPTYVALLRAINLGARRKFPKSDIVRVVESVGGQDVETHINTGNVRVRLPLRSPARVEQRLEAAFLADRGFEVPTIVFSPAELAAVAADAAAHARPGRHYVELLREAPPPDLAAAIEATSGGGREVHVSGRAVHLLVDDDVASGAFLPPGLTRLLGVSTNRNAKVVGELAARWT